MSGDPDTPPPPETDSKTAAPTFPDAPESPSPETADTHDRTVFAPRVDAPAPADASPVETAPPEGDAAMEATRWIPSAAMTAPPTPAAPPAPRAASPATSVGPGVVLNNIYEVKRFLARGGMGEVYEGFNVNTDERVAIKVMLPSLAADPNVQAMFRKEARTLTRLHHPAVVQYRVLAQEPHLNVFYIVTEFIDGAALSDLLAELDPSADDLIGLTRRLAQGLGAAHALGAVHRDMSPDNVLLPDRRLDQAKIIDFGIAKDMDPSKGTIVGDGFAGKLGYVAPEQFGDYDRQVGPWTDVYSLGLVILAVIHKRNVDMGATLVEAVDKRRAGPDLSRVPDVLRPVLAGMLAADPQKRFRSMEEVIAALDSAAAGPSTAQLSGSSAPPAAPRSRAPLIAGAAAAIIVILGGAAFLINARSQSKTSTPAIVGVDARKSVEAVLPGITCSWLELTDLKTAPAGLSVRLQGVAGRPAAAQVAISGAAAQSGLALEDLNLADVAPVGEPVCGALDTLRAFRTSDGGRLSTPQRKFEMVKQDSGKLAARAVINMSPRDPNGDFALVGLEPTGKMDVIFPSRADFNQLRAGLPADSSAIADLGGDAYRLQIDTDHRGWSGMLLVTGKGPFDAQLLSGTPEARGPDWPDRFRAAAAQGGWKTEMVWYRTVAAGEN